MADLVGENGSLWFHGDTEGPLLLIGTPEPAFGSVQLSAGFLPDPFELAMMAGGGINVEYLQWDCVGYAAKAPDFRVSWTGISAELRFLFTTDARSADTTLILNLPDGSWVCDDDGGHELNPMITIQSPSTGVYDVWVGTYDSDGLVNGVLSLTER